MLEIDNCIVSLDIIEKSFLCDLEKCKGACCIHGDSGAPLEDSETTILEEIFPIVKKYMREEGVKAIEKQGTHIIDSDGDKVTPLINGEECAYVIFDGEIAKCAIEKAWEEKEIDFQKPVSCHLYPIRITKYTKFDALNYHTWDICKCAVKLGKKENLPMYIFLDTPLIRKYGSDWYQQLTVVANEYIKQSISKKN
jgi:hypothetical protein